MMRPMKGNPLELASTLLLGRNAFRPPFLRPPVLSIGCFRCHPPIFKSPQQMRHFLSGLVVLAMTGVAQAGQLTILMPDGSPATKARVELLTLKLTGNEEPGKLVVNPLEVNSKGEVDLKDLESKQTYSDRLLVIDAPGAALALHNYFKSLQTVRLVPAFGVNGRMVTNEGELVADGNVSVAAFGIDSYVAIYQSLESIPGFHAKTDEKGRFKLRGASFNGYQQRVFEVLWEKTHQVHAPVLSSPKNGPQVADVSGLRIPTYDGKLCKGNVVDAVSGKPPIIPLDLGYSQESDPGRGWTVRTSGEWGNIGTGARTGKDGSFSMWLPTGPFSFTAKAGHAFNRKPYDHKQELDFKLGDHSPILIKVPS